MKEFLHLNGFTFNKETDFFATRHDMFGWGIHTYRLIYCRFEQNFNKHKNIISKEDQDWRKFKAVICQFSIKTRTIRNRLRVNIFFLDFLNTYRGLRHSKGLPVRGQRTWTNAWSVYKSNTNLRDFKIEIARKIYGNMPTTTLTTIYLAEQINYIWKLQWNLEWLQARSKRFKVIQDEHSIYKVDLNLMAKGYIDGYDRKKELSKKKKAQLQKNVFTLGFEPGFVLHYLKPNLSLNIKDRERVKVILTEEENKVKIVQKKLKILDLKKPEKKKRKKTAWE